MVIWGREHGFLGLLDDPARKALLQAGTERFYRASRPVYDEGGSAHTLAVLLEGRVKVAITTRRRHQPAAGPPRARRPHR